MTGKSCRDPEASNNTNGQWGNMPKACPCRPVKQIINMRTFIFGILLVMAVAIPFSGCDRQHCLSPERWVAAGGEFDSLTLKLERQFNDYAPYDSIGMSIAGMERLASAVRDSILRTLMTERFLYWKARYLWRLEYTDSSLTLAREALALNDSSRHRYDRLRILSLIYILSDTVDGATQYRHYEEGMEYARKVGDRFFEAHSATNLGNLLGSIGAYEQALHYFRVSDSLNEMVGYRKLPVKNRINVARVLEGMGHQERSARILRSLMGHPALRGDTFVMNLLPRNLYQIEDESVKYLHQAYDEIKDNPRFRFVRGLYLAQLANHCYRAGKYDSCVHYARKSVDDLPYIREYDHKALIWFNMSLALLVEGKLDSAYECRVRYEMYVDSAQMQRRGSEVLRLSALHELGAREEAYKASTFRRNMVTAFIALLVVAAGIVVVLWQNRRHLRQKVKAMQSELELEKAKRKMAATALSMEEKDKVLGSIRTELSEMRHDGDIKEGGARRLESTIRSHLLDHDNDEAFQQMFDVVNPDFTERLRARCPDLADSYVKLACYMLMELDSKKIARLMMIKLDSVRQAKWRLRQRLDIPEGHTLESFLRHLNSLEL